MSAMTHVAAFFGGVLLGAVLMALMAAGSRR